MYSKEKVIKNIQDPFYVVVVVFIAFALVVVAYYSWEGYKRIQDSQVSNPELLELSFFDKQLDSTTEQGESFVLVTDHKSKAMYKVYVDAYTYATVTHKSGDNVKMYRYPNTYRDNVGTYFRANWATISEEPVNVYIMSNM